MRDYLQAMQPTWQSSGLGFWTDYIYANGKKIAKVEELDRRVHTSGTFTSSGNELRWDLPVPLNSNGTAYVAQAGDRLCWRQFNEGGAWGGPVATFSNGLNSLNQWTDTAGVLVNQSGTPTQWLYRCADMTVGGAATNATLTGLGLTTDAQTPAGTWHIYYGDMVIAKANGALLPIITSQMPAPSVGSFQGGNWTGTPTAVAETPWEWLYGIPNYYLDDHLGTAQMELSSGGWPLWQGQFTPFGQEIIGGATTNYLGPQPADGTAMHYKFTGKERDTESGLDYFGARYYASNMGRFMSPDWAAKATPVPYAKLDNPQSLNLYAYVGNNPLSHIDPDGHIDCSGKNAQGAGCQAIAQWNQDHGISPNAKKSNFPGVPVKLPNGNTVPDPHSSTGVMMAPTSSLSDVAAAGKKAGQDAQRLDSQSIGGVVFTVELGKAVGTGGQFDDQRMGPQSDVITGGFMQLPQFRDVSNFNVGLFSQQAGMTLDQTLQTAGDFAKHFSSNYSPNSPYGLAPQTAEFIRIGWQAGATQY